MFLSIILVWICSDFSVCSPLNGRGNWGHFSRLDEVGFVLGDDLLSLPLLPHPPDPKKGSGGGGGVEREVTLVRKETRRQCFC